VKEQDPATLVYTPGEVSSLTLEAIEDRRSTRDRGVLIGVDAVDRVLKPMRPGELVSVIALSSNWKTGLMQHLARRTAATLPGTGNECVLYVTWEIAVEEAGLLDLANATGLDIGDVAEGNVADWDKLKRAAVARGALPIVVIGHSLKRRKSRPMMTMTNVALAVRWLEDHLGLRVRLACLDYLQRIEWEGEGDPRIQYSRNVQRCKDMALSLGAPVVLGCQAKQEVMDRNWKLPRMNDGMETASVMHASDKIIGLWRPVVTDGPGATIGQSPAIDVTDDLLLLGISKQRFGRVGDWWALNVDFAQNRIRGVMETINTENV
jgi:replicative DNA helicase